MSTPLVTNLRSPRSGTPVANQYEIKDGDAYIFQSYRTLIAKKQPYAYTISSNYNYSRTTSKYFTEWLDDNGMNSAERQSLRKWLSTAEYGSSIVIGDVSVTYVEEL